MFSFACNLYLDFFPPPGNIWFLFSLCALDLFIVGVSQGFPQSKLFSPEKANTPRLQSFLPLLSEIPCCCSLFFPLLLSHISFPSAEIMFQKHRLSWECVCSLVCVMADNDNEMSDYKAKHYTQLAASLLCVCVCGHEYVCSCCVA